MPKSTKDKMEVPSDEMLVAAIATIRADNPTMGREKLKAAVQRENKNWDLSGNRFKQILRDHHLDTEAAQKQQEMFSSKQRDNSFKEFIKPAFEEYRDRERAFLLGLNENERYALDQDMKKPTRISETHLRSLERMNGKPLSKNDPRLYQRKSSKPKWFFAAHFRFHLQVLMVLMGHKPVVIFSNEKYAGTVVLERMVNKCLVPIFKKYNLGAYGFALQKIDHPMSQQGGPGLQGAMIFVDLRLKNEGINKILQEVFCSFHISQLDMARLLGLPMAGGMQVVRYKDMTEMAWLWKAIGKDSGDCLAADFAVPCLEYHCCLDGALFREAVQSHFSCWADTAKNVVGVMIMLDTGGQARE